MTFDDHAPIRYYSATAHLRDIKLGKPTFERRSRNTGGFLQNLMRFWRKRHNDKAHDSALGRLVVGPLMNKRLNFTLVVRKAVSQQTAQ